VKVSGGSEVVGDQLNVPLEDAELLAEVELTTNLIIAASEADDTLPQAEVDRLLGVSAAAPSTEAAGRSAAGDGSAEDAEDAEDSVTAERDGVSIPLQKARTGA
jgi:hypothetical protein